MTTTLAQRPVLDSRNGGAPARRAVARWAWRLLRREWRQQTLVLALLTVAVAATTIGLGLVSNVAPSDQASLGLANTRIDFNPGQQLATDLAAARQSFGTVEVISHQNVAVPGSVTPVDLRDQDPRGVYGHPMLKLTSGSYPSGPAQVAVTTGVAATFTLKLGAAWDVNGRVLHVVGTIENPKNLADQFALVAPGQANPPASVTLLVDASNSQVMSFRLPGDTSGLSIMSTSASGNSQRQAFAVLLIATIGLTFIGLLAVAGFTVMAQRRMRALGMIAAIGASDRNVRLVMLSNGAAVGGVGAALGTAIGLAVWLAFKPVFEKIVGHQIDVFQLPWWAILAGAALAVITAVAAAWWPARAIARVPIVVALSGRPARPQPAHRFAALGAVVAGAGAVLLAQSHQHSAALTVGGILATTIGILLLAPLGIGALAAIGNRAPIAIRLAVRDLARYQSRSGAALAAASLAIGIAATVAISAAAAQRAADRPLTAGNLATNQLDVWINGSPGSGPPGGGGSVGITGSSTHKQAVTANGPGSTSAITPAELAALQSRVNSLAQSIGAKSVLALETARDTTVTNGPPDVSMVKVSQRGGGTEIDLITVPYVATSAVLSYYGIAPASVAPSTQILTSRRDLAGIQLSYGGQSNFIAQPVLQHTVQLPAYTSAPSTLITMATIEKLGLTAAPAGWLVETPHQLTAAQITQAQHAAAAAGMVIETRENPGKSLTQLRNDATTVGVLVALGVLAMTVGLIRSETARDLRTLAAAGASGATRRTLTAATAGALALLGGILGTAGAYLALIAWRWHDIDYLSQPPFADLAVLIVGLPIVATVAGWLLGRTPTTIARSPLE